MLVVTRKKNEKICIGNDIVVTVIEIGENRVSIGIEAPREFAVHRQEVMDKIRKQRLTDDDE